MKVWYCVLIMYFGLLVTDAALAKANGGGSLTAPGNESHMAIKTSCLLFFKAKKTRDASIVNKAIVAPRPGRLSGISPGAPKNNAYITGTGINRKR